MRPLAALNTLALLAYPFLYLALSGHVGPLWLGGVLAVLLVIRIAGLGGVGKTLKAWLVAGVTAIVATVFLSSDGDLLKLYPVAINASLLAFGVYTLRHPPSALERLVVRMKLTISPEGTAYLRILTMVWCGFFVVNGSIAAFTALATPTAVWTLYNGAVSYALAGLLFGIEYLYRGYYQRRIGRRGTSAAST